MTLSYREQILNDKLRYWGDVMIGVSRGLGNLEQIAVKAAITDCLIGDNMMFWEGFKKVPSE